MMGVPRIPFRANNDEATVQYRISRYAEMKVRRPYKRHYPQSHIVGPLHREWLLCVVCRLLRQAGRI